MRCPLLLTLGLLSLASCGDDPNEGGAWQPESPNDKPVVLTTFYPTTYFATRIAGDLAEVRCPLPADADPIFWKPSEDVLASYQAADRIVANGAKFEKWIEQVSLPTSRLVKTAAGFRDRWLRVVETTHSHGPGGEHSHFGYDGHTWLDPQLAILQSRAIADALIELRPDRAADFEARFASLEKDLQELHVGFEGLGEQPEGESLYASHPSYHYLEKRYRWRIVNVDLDPETMPTEAVLEDLKRQLQNTPGRYVLWEREPDAAVARALHDVGLRSLILATCKGSPTGAPDYLARMRSNIEGLSAAFE